MITKILPDPVFSFYEAPTRWVEGCAACDRYKAEGDDHAPPHEPSRFCQSGKHKHCTCDYCF